MKKLKDLRRIAYENYTTIEEQIEYYQRKVIILNEIGTNEQIINSYLNKIQQLKKQLEESNKLRR